MKSETRQSKRSWASERMSSERGASFSVALLLLLVCVAVSAIVIAAATAAVGHVSGQVKADQRYYSVTSAVQLFRDSLVGDELALTYVQERRGTRDERTGSEIESTWAQVTPPTEDQIETASGPGYVFLPDLTSMALFGTTDATTRDSDLQEANWGVWLTPFSADPGDWFADAVDGAKDISYNVKPNLPAELGSVSADVTVTARLHDDWMLELDFANVVEDEGDPVYHFYLVYEADVTNDDRKSEELGDTTVGSGEAASVSNTVTVNASRITTVKWTLQQVVPGRGLS